LVVLYLLVSIIFVLNCFIAVLGPCLVRVTGNYRGMGEADLPHELKKTVFLEQFSVKLCPMMGKSRAQRSFP
jgi:hypothetical protein